MRRRGQLRVLIAAFGDAGHAFPAIALARALDRRGHRAVVETWEQWREQVTGEGLEFAAAQEYRAFAGVHAADDSVPSIAAAATALRPLLDDLAPDLVISDILTSAPALAAEVAGVRRATLIPHVFPVGDPDLPFFGFGARPARTPIGRAAWRAGQPLFEAGLRRGRREHNATRAELGLAPSEEFHAGISRDLALVATFPQLEYPRPWPAGVEVTGPMFFEMDYPDVELPGGGGPLVVVAPSTSKDPDLRLIRAVLEGLADEPVRVLATTNLRTVGGPPLEVPANARVVDWASYSQVMTAADLVICHGGHGTLARALACGAPVLSCGSAGDMAENGARIAWAGVGLALPRRLARAGPVRWATRRILGDTGFSARALEVAAWSAENDGAERGAELVEALAAGPA
jgi:UDP:flavonoid glycosyltransferase YjiC (YdhE family)